MLLTDLPLDVLDSLCSFLRPIDLLALALTANNLRTSSQRYLYRSISLYSAPTALRCLATLARSTMSLCAHVRAFSLRIDPDMPLISELPDLLAAVLARLHGLVSLDLVIPASATPAIYKQLVMATRLHWQYPHTNASAPGHEYCTHQEGCQSGRKQKGRACDIEDRLDACQTRDGTLYPRLQHLSSNLPLDEPAVRELLLRAPALRELQLGERLPSPNRSGLGQSTIRPSVIVDAVAPISSASLSPAADDPIQHPESQIPPSTADGIIRTSASSGSLGQGIMSDVIVPDAVLPASALPHLSLFMGPSDAAMALVPGRPVESVHLYPGELSADVLSALARSATPITVLGALTHALSPAVVQDLAATLPHLVHLRIMTMYHAQNQPDEAFYAQVLQVLSTMPELVSAELAGIRWANRNKTKDAKPAARTTKSRVARVPVTTAA